MDVRISILPKTVVRILLTLILILSVGQIITLILINVEFSNGLLNNAREAFINLFNFDSESNFPTFYSSFALFLCGVLLAIIVITKRRADEPYMWHWGILSVGFIYLAIDEMSKLHEKFATPVAALLDIDNIKGVWVLVGIPLVILLLLFYWKFLFQLPSRTRNLFIVAGTIFVVSATALDAISTRVFGIVYGTDDTQYLLLASAEEFLEMVSIVIFAYAVLNYIRSMNIKLYLDFGSDNE